MADIKSLPEGWKFCKLGDLVDMQSGVAFKKSEYSLKGVKLFQIANVSFNYTKWDEIEHLPESYRDKFPQLLLHDGDIVMALNRPLLNDKLKIAKITNTDLPSILYQRVGRFKFLKNDSKLYFLYYLQSQPFINWLKEQLQGVNIPFINKSKLLSFDLFPYAPIETQKLIVSKIEELFSELDKGIAELKLAQEQLKVYRQSVLKYAFEGRLTNDNVKDGELPKGWQSAKLGEVINISTRKHAPIKHEELFYIGLEHIAKNSGKLTNNVGSELIKTVKNKFQKGDILYGKLRPNLNKVYLAQEDGVCSTDILVINASEKCVAKYLSHIMLSVGFVNLMSENTSGVNLPRVSSKFILSYEILLPPIDEQNRIIQEIESRLSVAEKLEESILESLQKAEALRQSILKNAFSGELVTEVKIIEIPKIKNDYFHQLQLVALVINGFKKKKIDHGEMTLAKNLYLLDSIYKIPTGFKYDRWHLGPYPPALKKVVNNKECFKRNENFIETANDEKLLKYANPLQDEVNSAISDLSSIFSKYKGAERSHKTELLATVCKVIEDIKSTDLDLVRQSMKEWKIKLATSKFKNKAEKFNESETEKCIGFIIERGWDRKLI